VLINIVFMTDEFTEYSELNGDAVLEIVQSLKEEANELKFPPTFMCEFEDPISPSNFIKKTFQNNKYKSIAFPHKISSEDEYYQINGIVGLKEYNGAKFNAEICKSWMRVYIRSDCSVGKIGEFLEEIFCDYSYKIIVASEYMD